MKPTTRGESSWATGESELDLGVLFFRTRVEIREEGGRTEEGELDPGV
jgi:hypothetical protein